MEIDIAVIGGGVGKAGDVLFEPLRKALSTYATLSFVRHLTVAPAQMGTDAGLVGAAAAALAGGAEVVIGPAEDGGYYLLGLGASLPWLFGDMPWGTDAVLAITLRRLAERGIVPVLLDTLADLDRPEDLLRWPELGR